MVAGVRVEAGLWDGSPAFYRDALTGQAPSAPDDARFRFLAHTITDAQGRFRFDNMPRKVAYAIRVILPKGVPRAVSYGETMFGIPRGDIEAFPTIRVPTR